MFKSFNSWILLVAKISANFVSVVKQTGSKKKKNSSFVLIISLLILHSFLFFVNKVIQTVNKIKAKYALVAWSVLHQQW